MTSLHEMLATELDRPLSPAIAKFARRLADEAGANAVAVLFYGSARRTGALDGVLDFYVLLERPRLAGTGFAWRQGLRVLPPNVGYRQQHVDGIVLRAKVAWLTLAQFQRRARTGSLDTSIWARFAQPTSLLFVRDAAARTATIDAIAGAVATAARWAALLGPRHGTAAAFWQTLFQHTYAAELRVETSRRAADIVAAESAWFTGVLRPAWQQGGVAFSESNGELIPEIEPTVRATARRAWRFRHASGKPRNVLRLLKAAFTFAGGADYLAWKIERHSGEKLDLQPWQRRHPILAAPAILWRLRRKGTVR